MSDKTHTYYYLINSNDHDKSLPIHPLTHLTHKLIPISM